MTAYGGNRRTPLFGRPEPPGRTWKRGRDDRRYHCQRYRRFRLRVLVRDNYNCFVGGCIYPGNVLDHIEPVTADTPDALFYDERNARASCRRHNAARGWQTYASRELGEPVSIVGRDGKPMYRYHLHEWPKGRVGVQGGYMSKSWHWPSDGTCPPECPLPKGA